MKKILYLTIILLLSFSCGKEKDPDSTAKDCETNTYGVITITYGVPASRHAIFITGPNGIREKQALPGTVSDTLKLTSGSYSIKVYDFITVGQPINEETYNRNITNCFEETISFSF